MVRGTLMGSHSHPTDSKIDVHVYRRADKYLARGRFQGRPFGVTLGSSEHEANVRLRQLLADLDAGSFISPREAKKRQVSQGRVARLTLRQLTSEFLSEKRKTRGQQTVANYRARLRPVLDFVEQPTVFPRWPLAMDINRAFVIELRFFKSTRGNPQRSRRCPSKANLCGANCQRARVLGTMLCWARQADVRKLPVTWINPLSVELIGRRPSKDPLHNDPLPIEQRMKIVALMNRWQLCQLALSIILPCARRSHRLTCYRRQFRKRVATNRNAAGRRRLYQEPHVIYGAVPRGSPPAFAPALGDGTKDRCYEAERRSLWGRHTVLTPRKRFFGYLNGIWRAHGRAVC